jgi:nucleotide-binding universal stress UspA family protein
MSDQFSPEGHVEPATFEIGTDGIGHLVVGLDGTPPSLDALALAAGIARRNHASVTVVFVAQMPTGAELSGGAAAAVIQNWDVQGDELRTMAEKQLGNVTWRFIRESGDVPMALEKIAEEEHADVIIVGRSGSRLPHLTGSVPTRLLRHARRPIVVVP